MKLYTVLVTCALWVACDGSTRDLNESNVSASRADPSLAHTHLALSEGSDEIIIEPLDEVPPSQQETPDPEPRSVPESVQLDFETVTRDLQASPRFAATMASMGQRSATGPRTLIETTTGDNDQACSTGQHRDDDEGLAEAVTANLVARDRSSVPLEVRLQALQPHETDLEADRVDGPETPVPFRY